MLRIILIILALLVSLPLLFKSRVGTVNAPVAFSVISSGRTIVRVSGDVRHSGIYRVSANSLTKDVIFMADINDSTVRFTPNEIAERPVVNGSDFHLTIKHDRTATITVGSIPASERIILGIPLNINTMSEADFDRLPGVGAVMARRIVEYRQNNGGKMAVEDLHDIDGIGEMKYQKLCSYF